MTSRIIFLNYYSNLLFILYCGGTLCAIVHIWRPEDNLLTLVFFFHHVSSKDQTWVGGKLLYHHAISPAQGGDF